MSQLSSIRRIFRRSALVFAITGILLGAGAAIAEATHFLYWNSATQPLTVTDYGSTVKGYGKWRVATGTDGTRSRLTVTELYLKNADDHKKYAVLYTYVNSGSCISPQYTSCSKEYYHYDTAETYHSSLTGWTGPYYASTGVPGDADYARAGVKVRIDVPWRPDPASGTTWTQGYPY